jgi:hypothetical protein
VTVVGGFEFCGCEVVVGFEDPAVVEPVDVVQGREFDVFDGAPWSLPADQFGLEQPDDGLGQGVVVGVADRADGGVDAGVDEPFGERDRGVLAARSL